MLNAIVAWSGLKDSMGLEIRKYNLRFHDHGLLDWKSGMWEACAQFLWVIFMGISALSATLLKLIADPTWLDKLDEWYRKIADTAFGVVNPLVIAACGFTLLLLYLSFDKVTSTTVKFTHADINRLVAAFTIMVGIAFFAARPLLLLKMSLSLVNAVVTSIVGKGVVDGFSVDALIRQPTLLINYNGTLSLDCADKWSKTGGFPKGDSCITPGTDSASAVTPILAVLSIILALSTLAFAGWAVWKFFKHLLTSVVAFVSLPWVAAGTLFKRRQFDAMGTVLSIAVGNMIMVFVIQVISIGGPLLADFILGDSPGSMYMAIPKMFGLIVAYLAMLGFLMSVTGKHSALVAAIKADTLRKLNSYIGSGNGGGMFSHLGGVSVLDGLRQAHQNPINAAKSTKAKGVEVWDTARNKVAGVKDKIRSKFGREREVDEDLKEVQHTEQFPDAEKKNIVDVTGGQSVPRPSDTYVHVEFIRSDQNGADMGGMRAELPGDVSVQMGGIRVDEGGDSGDSSTAPPSPTSPSSPGDDGAAADIIDAEVVDEPETAGIGSGKKDVDGRGKASSGAGRLSSSSDLDTGSGRRDSVFALPAGSIPSHAEVSRELVEDSLTSDDPSIGGRSPETLLEDMSDYEVSRRMERAKALADERTARPDVVDPDGNVESYKMSPTERMARFHDARDAAVEHNAEMMGSADAAAQMNQSVIYQSTVSNVINNLTETRTEVDSSTHNYDNSSSAFITSSVHNVDARVSNVSNVDARVSNVSNVDSRVSNVSNIDNRVVNMTNTTNVSTVHNVSNVMNVAVTTTVATYPSLRAGDDAVVVSNALKGGSATRGDVQTTRTSSLCDRGDLESVTEHVVQKARALGQGFTPSISLTDHRQDLAFTPDNPHSPVSVKYDCGFGDRIR